MTPARFDLPGFVDVAVPYSGPCAFCGGPEARHRVLDAIVERYRAGESITDIALDYRKTVKVVEAICGHWSDTGQRWVA